MKRSYSKRQMAQAKRCQEAAYVPPGPKPPIVDSDGYRCITGELLWKYRAVDAELRNARLSEGKLDAELELAIHTTGSDLVRRLWRDYKMFRSDTKGKYKALKEVNAEIEEVLGMSLVNCGIDDNTGRVLRFGADGVEAVPILANSRVGGTISKRRSH